MSQYNSVPPDQRTTDSLEELRPKAGLDQPWTGEGEPISLKFNFTGRKIVVLGTLAAAGYVCGFLFALLLV